MAIKLTVYEKCPQCGERDARLDGQSVIVGLHRCAHAPPGPAALPRQIALSRVNFVSAEMTRRAALYKTKGEQ